MPITGKSLRASLNKEITKRAYVNTCFVWPRFQLYECFCVSITLFLSKELHEITLYLDVTKFFTYLNYQVRVRVMKRFIS